MCKLVNNVRREYIGNSLEFSVQQKDTRDRKIERLGWVREKGCSRMEMGVRK